LVTLIGTKQSSVMQQVLNGGDLNWYQAIFCDAAGIKWDDILDTNADKLFKKKEARYKDGFSDKDANERNLTAERKVLDTLKIKSS